VQISRRVGLGDVRPDGRARLDALARFLQDVADEDAVRASLDVAGVWVLRRVALRILDTPRFRADLALSTWCSGVGPRWAERRTDVEVGGRVCVEAVALWAYIDPTRGVPLPLPGGFDDHWGPTAGGRRVSARLRHPSPSAPAPPRPWPLRATDIDVLGHVNNAAYWAPVEDELARRGRPRVEWAELEFRDGLDSRDEVETLIEEREGGLAMWMCVGDDVRASALLGFRSR
jgi:acyl-ACP thioesterase